MSSMRSVSAAQNKLTIVLQDLQNLNQDFRLRHLSRHSGRDHRRIRPTPLRLTRRRRQTYRGRVGDVYVDVTRFEGKLRESGAVESERTSWATKDRAFNLAVVRRARGFEAEHAGKPGRCCWMISSMVATAALRTWRSPPEMPCCLTVLWMEVSRALRWAAEAGGSARSSFSSCFS